MDAVLAIHILVIIIGNLRDNEAYLLSLNAGRQQIAEASAVQTEEHLVEGHVLINASHDGAVLLFL